MTAPLELLPNTYRAFFAGFSALTNAQKQLIQPILSGEDVILQASTGAGKTEAVLAPATEKLMTAFDHFTIIYIVPTRALALDMNRRIKPIYKKLGLKSGIRTGDGKELCGGKPNLLIMTPESLDVMLGSSNLENKYFLKHVRILIIDEVHIFLHNNRGYQLAYLRRRLSVQCSRLLQTVVLSATIDNSEDVIQFFNLSRSAFYYKQSVSRKLQPRWIHIEDEERELPLLFNDLYRQSGCKKLLVFANSRKKCEQLYDILYQGCLFSKAVFLHYSNLSTKERKRIEASFRNEKIGVCIATSTLELGIDIGDIDGVVLIEPPPSTMAFLQRIGRGNRRQQYINFWGVCCGVNPGMQLICFLAFFELAKEHQVEKCQTKESYSVLFQQVLSCLYAKKALSKDALASLFKDKSESLLSIFHHMLAKNWLKETKLPGIYDGGWRYFLALKRQHIWSNFPDSDKEYDIILENETIATLSLSIVKQLNPGDIIRLTGKVLRVLQIEEKRTSSEVLVEASNKMPDKRLVWMGLGMPVPFEVAQKIKTILLGSSTFEGLFSRTSRLLEKEKEKIQKSVEQPNGIFVYWANHGAYRYETFLGSIGNYILYNIISDHFKSRGLIISFDEIGIECSEWISFESLEIPHTIEQIQRWISSNLHLFKGSFSWNSWMRWLPEEYQQKEMTSYLYDSRVLQHFQRYQLERQWISVPKHNIEEDQQTANYFIELKGDPWSLEKEKNAWGSLSFNLTKKAEDGLCMTPKRALTASQIQSYVKQKLCPRLAWFQKMGFEIESHPRFAQMDETIKLQRQEGITFKKEVIEVLKSQKSVFFETPELNWQSGIKKAIADRKSLFLVQIQLNFEGLMSGSPDLIYVRNEGSHICLEVWDIKSSKSVSYSQKWKIAFYVYLLDFLLKNETFEMPIQISALGGLVYPSKNQGKLFEKDPFVLSLYTTWISRLVSQWRIDAEKSSSFANPYMESSCTSCRYFSYCYQETFLANEKKINGRVIISKNIESNDFPRNSKHWYFINFSDKEILWQCWENGEVINAAYLYSQDFLSEEVFHKEVVSRLSKEWIQSSSQGKNPHLLFYEGADWNLFQKTFQSTALKMLWATHACWTSIQSVLETHFIWPIEGRLTPTQVGVCLGIVRHPVEPLSFYHKEFFSKPLFDVCRHIWSWCLSKVKSSRLVSFEKTSANVVPLIQTYLAMHHRETECHFFEIFEFQKKTLVERVKQFRAIGPISFVAKLNNKEGYQFSVDVNSTISKFRVGDFLKLSPVGSCQIQDGLSVALTTYLPKEGLLSVRPLSRKASVNKNQLYVLDEDATDWNASKTIHILNLLKNPKFRPEVMEILLGHAKKQASDAVDWIKRWYESQALRAQLNSLQQEALCLPFREKVGLIEGPPGTGKTHLLVWTIIALLAHAQFLNRPIKILVTAQTHHAINQILRKIAGTLPVAEIFDVSLRKYGRFDENEFLKMGISYLQEVEALYDRSCCILGATGFGVYQLLENKNFPQLFDWVIFDESSQILTPHACLSLIFGKGQALFYGDTQQLPPILKGSYEHTSIAPCSVLQELINRYGSQNYLRLNETYRMNVDICDFASKQWYDGKLQSVLEGKNQYLDLPTYPLFKDLLDDYLDPYKSMVSVQLGHVGSKESSEEEAKWIARAVKRLVEDYFISPTQIGIISPHRLQNNTIVSALKETLHVPLKLPAVDTVERMQGLEFDIVIFSATVSDKDSIYSPFLKDYRRFNVALTRARKKFIFVASKLFFQSFPRTEKELIEQIPFEAYNRLFFLQETYEKLCKQSL